MGYICPYCGEGLPEDELCACTMGYEDLEEEEEEVCPGECLAHRQHIYILCYGRPVLVRDRDYLRRDPSKRYPISHYVGWTSQLPPIKRVRQHGAKSAHYIAQIRPGTMLDEEHAKRFEPCPRCGQSLWYFAESPTYSEEYAKNPAPDQGALLRASESKESQTTAQRRGPGSGLSCLSRASLRGLALLRVRLASVGGTLMPPAAMPRPRRRSSGQ
jgi:hypothetical protein